MRQRLSAIGIFMLVMLVVLGGVTGCNKPAPPPETEATEPADSQPTPTSSAGSETSDAAPPTVVSAVTPTPGGPAAPEATAPGTEVQPTQVPVAGETPAVQPTSEAGTEVSPPAATAAPSPASSGGSVVWHTVQPGQTLSSIARRYGTTWQAIARANSLSNPNQIYVGQKLKIPTGSGGSSGGATGCRIRHKVRLGEWVWQIARNYGVSPYDILAANGLTIHTANTIYPGTVLCIP